MFFKKRFKIYKGKIRRELYQYYINNINFYSLWVLGFSAFAADEVFGRMFEILTRVGLLSSSLFLLDRFVSYFFGPSVIKDVLNWIVRRIYFERLDILILISFFLIACLLLLMICGIFSFIISFGV